MSLQQKTSSTRQTRRGSLNQNQKTDYHFAYEWYNEDKGDYNRLERALVDLRRWINGMPVQDVEPIILLIKPP